MSKTNLGSNNLFSGCFAYKKTVLGKGQKNGRVHKCFLDFLGMLIIGIDKQRKELSSDQIN